MAPVSISASPCIAPGETRPDELPRSLRTAGVVARQDSKATRRRSMQPALFRGLGGMPGIPQPVADRRIKNRSNRYFAEPRLPFQFQFELAGHAPTIHFALHVLHCSALGTGNLRRLARAELRVPAQRAPRPRACPTADCDVVIKTHGYKSSNRPRCPE